jgi:hypothetical protein
MKEMRRPGQGPARLCTSRWEGGRLLHVRAGNHYASSASVSPAVIVIARSAAPVAVSMRHDLSGLAIFDPGGGPKQRAKMDLQ